MKRRPVTPTSLAFLDIMFCGFGAVVLLVLILNHDTVEARNETFADLRAEAVQRQQGIIVTGSQLNEQQKQLAQTNNALISAAKESQQLIAAISDYRAQIASLNQSSNANRDSVKKLSADIKRLENKAKRLRDQEKSAAKNGNKIINRSGDGDRQYLTGLKVGGKRILILFDTSASMLDETIINILRRRNMNADKKRLSPKWQRSLAALEWLVSQLPENSKFQIYAFNTKATSVLKGFNGKWISASNSKQVQEALVAARKILPADGTSLYHAFAAIKSLSPRPDNILLITDGLPTQGETRTGKTTVTAEQRLNYFFNASQLLSTAVPVNTILMPMEGDAQAAAAFWKLAIDTQGSFITPARDWP